MSIDQAFILSAGKGTRMGELGKLWPKPLWNLYETNLLGLQIEYVKSLGVNRIVVNAHHLHEYVQLYLRENHPSVLISHEPELLGSGGGVHKVLNEALVDKDKPLAVFNSDSFLFEKKENWDKLLSLGEERNVDTALFMCAVTSDDSYNAVAFDKDGKMLSIEKDKSEIRNPHTYSGFGVVFPNRLEKSEGASSFFSTVADYRRGKVFCFKSEEDLIDFGTVEIYKKIVKESLRENSPIHQKLKEFSLVNENLVKKSGYGIENVFDFAKIEKVGSQVEFTIGRKGTVVKTCDDVGLFLD